MDLLLDQTVLTDEHVFFFSLSKELDTCARNGFKVKQGISSYINDILPLDEKQHPWGYCNFQYRALQYSNRIMASILLIHYYLFTSLNIEKKVSSQRFVYRFSRYLGQYKVMWSWIFGLTLFGFILTSTYISAYRPAAY